MAKINSRYGKLQIDFRYKGQRCREQTKFEDTPQHRQRLKKIVERIEAEITLSTFVYRDYFPKSAKADFFDELEIYFTDGRKIRWEQNCGHGHSLW